MPGMFEPMTKIVPIGKKGVAKVDHFTVSQEASQLTAFRRGGYVPSGEYARLTVGHTLMMTDTRMEQNSNYGVVRASYGDVLIAGLGIGMITIPILRKPEVQSVTIIEKYQDVVDLVEPALREKIPEATKLKVIVADIMDWTPPKGQKWDTIYFDIWPDITTENLKDMEVLHRRFARRKRFKDSWMDSWMRNTLKAQQRRDKQHRGHWW